MDYLSLLEHTQQIIGEQFPDEEIKVLYVCKPNMVPKLSPVALKDANFGVVTVCRTPESDTLRNTLTAKWNGVITVGMGCVASTLHLLKFHVSFSLSLLSFLVSAIPHKLDSILTLSNFLSL